MSTQLNTAGNDGSAVINWDTSRDDQNVRFDFGLKNVETAALIDRSVSFKTTLPRRAVGLAFAYTLTADKFMHSGDLQWDADAQSEFKYEVEANRAARRGLVTYDGRFKIQSALVNSENTFNHKITNGKRHQTEIVVGARERLTIKSDLTVSSSTTFVHLITVQHPQFVKVSTDH